MRVLSYICQTSEILPYRFYLNSFVAIDTIITSILIQGVVHMCVIFIVESKIAKKSDYKYYLTSFYNHNQRNVVLYEQNNQKND